MFWIIYYILYKNGEYVIIKILSIQIWIKLYSNKF
jgi:hypothetical protein